MQIHELPEITSISSGGYFATDNGSQTTKIDYDALAKAIIEQYSASTLAGSAQSVKAALNRLKTNLDVVYGPNAIKTLATTDDLLTLEPGMYRISNAIPLNAPTDAYKYGYVEIQNRGASGYTYYTYVVGSGNGTTVRAYNGWKAGNSAKVIAWSEAFFDGLYAMSYNGMIKVADAGITDLNAVTTPGSYVVTSAVVAASLSNSPINDTGFSLHVESVAGGTGQYIIQTAKHIRSNNGETYIRTYTGSMWGAWQKEPTRAEIDELNSKNAGTTYNSVEDLYNYGINTPGFKLATITSAVASSLTNGVITSASRIFLCRADNTTVDALLFSLASGKIYLSRISNGVAVKAYTASVTEISLS